MVDEAPTEEFKVDEIAQPEEDSQLATIKDVHRIAKETVMTYLHSVLWPGLEESTKVATVSLIIQDLLVRKGLATEEDFQTSINALEAAKVIRRVGASRPSGEPQPEPDSAP